VDNITPRGFIRYIKTLRHAKTNQRLSKSLYGNKHSALFDLFRLHGLQGYPDDLEGELKNLFTGFQRIRAAHAAEGECELEEGKKPMSVELYVALCCWFL
jgi:hypothetical protein